MILNELLTDCELSEIVAHTSIKARDKYKSPPAIISIGDSVIATLENFSASSGKAKAKKTFNVSAMAAAALSNSEVLHYSASMPADKSKILYIDTEQSRYHCHKVLTRILALADCPADKEHPNLDFICLREYSAAVRVQIIDYLLRTRSGYGLVIIDGLRDLLIDINSITESVEVITKLMQWSSNYGLHIHVVLHLNKGDDKVRGHIGTELSNKAETILVVQRDPENGDISEVRSIHVRDKEFRPFEFKISEDGLPILADEENKAKIKSKQLSFVKLTRAEHRAALRATFKGQKIKGYDFMLDALADGYTSIGYIRQRTQVSRLLTYLRQDLKMIKKDKKTYSFIDDEEIATEDFNNL